MSWVGARNQKLTGTPERNKKVYNKCEIQLTILVLAEITIPKQKLHTKNEIPDAIKLIDGDILLINCCKNEMSIFLTRKKTTNKTSLTG